MESLLSDELFGFWSPLVPPAQAREDGGPSTVHAMLRSQLDALAATEILGVHTRVDQLELLADEEWLRVSKQVATCAEELELPWRLAVGGALSGPGADRTLGRIARAAALEPAAIDLAVALSEVGLEALRDAAQAARGVGFVVTPSKVGWRVEALEAVLDLLGSAVIGVRLPSADEDLLDALRPREEELAVFVPGPELASGWRHGAAGADDDVSALSPTGACRWYGMLEHDVRGALDLERRLGRWLDGFARPVARRFSLDPGGLQRLLVAVGAWCDLGAPPVTDDVLESLRAAAVELVPELL